MLVHPVQDEELSILYTFACLIGKLQGVKFTINK